MFTQAKLFHKAGEGSGGGSGGDEHNLGWYATESALTTAHPTATDGDWAIVGETDTVWVWDSDTSAWVDTDSKAEVTPDMIIVKSATMPTASTVPAGAVYQYVGASNASYTHGYIYENVATPTYDSTVSFEAATLSSSTIACSGSDFAAFVAEWGSGDITTITNGTLTYDQSGGLLVFVGKDAEDTTVCTFQMYTEDYQDAGFTITGTLQDGDVFAFTTTITESFSYAWTRVDVQPTPSELPNQSGNSGKFLTTDGTNPSWATVGGLPSQTGNAGKFLTTDGTSPSWSDKPLVNTATGTNATAVSGLGNATATQQHAVAFGNGATASGSMSTAIGASANATGQLSISLGMSGQATAKGAITIGSGYAQAERAIMLGYGHNNEAHTLYAGTYYNNTELDWKLLDLTDGTIPTARLTNAINKYSSMPTAGADYLGQIAQFTGATDATYTHGYIYECVSDGGNPATYSWTAVSVQAGGGSSLPSQTGNAGKFLTTDGTDASWSDKPLVNKGGSIYSLVVGAGNGTGSGNCVAIGFNASSDAGVSIGDGCKGRGVNIGSGCTSIFSYGIALGYQATTTASAIQMCMTQGFGYTNSDANTFKVSNANGNFEIMSADGTVPTDRYTTTPSADGTYYPTLTIASGTPTRSWATINALQNINTSSTGVGIGTDMGGSTIYVSGSVSIGTNVQASADCVVIGSYARSFNQGYGVAIGNSSYLGGSKSIAIGYSAKTGADNAIQLNASSNTVTNSDANTFKVANGNGNFEIMNANGNLPADRLASTTGLADGNYRLRLTMASGVPTLTWVAE